MRKVSIILVIIAVICTFFFNFETTSSRKADLMEEDIFDTIEMSMVGDNFLDVIAWVAANREDQYNTNNDLSFWDGVKNGILAPASYARDVIVGTICDYLSGFEGKGSGGKIVWAIFGLIFEVLKNALFSIFGSIIFVFKLLLQKGSILYYVGYIISTLTSISFIAQAIGVDLEPKSAI